MSVPTVASSLKRTPWEIQRAVLFALLQREMKTRFGGHWYGAFWVLFEPIAHLSYLMMLYAVIRGRVVPGVPIVMFLLTGIVPFIMFRSVSLRVMGSVDGSRGLFGYRQVKPIDPVIARVGLEVLLYSFVFVVFLTVFGWFGVPWIPDHPLEVMASIGVLILFGFGLGLLFVVLTDDFPKTRVFIRLAYLPLYLFSGVIFPTSSLPKDARDWLVWNPVLQVMEDIRGSFFNEYQIIPEASLAYPFAVALVTLAVALALYRLRHKRLLAS